MGFFLTQLEKRPTDGTGVGGGGLLSAASELEGCHRSGKDGSVVPVIVSPSPLTDAGGGAGAGGGVAVVLVCHVILTKKKKSRIIIQNSAEKVRSVHGRIMTDACVHARVHIHCHLICVS